MIEAGTVTFRLGAGRSGLASAVPQETEIMAVKTLYISESDRKRLQSLLEQVGPEDLGSRRDLDVELRLGRVVPPAEMPPDIVTMNSRIRLTDLDSAEELVYTLVYPAEADYAAGKISVLAPVGTALLGERVGNEIVWDVPGGTRRLRIEELLYQPESSGDLDR